MREQGRLLLARPSVLGLVVAAWFFAQSLAPSLLARSWLFQGLVAGLAIPLGYGLGVGLTWLAHTVASRGGRPLPHLSPGRELQVRAGVVTLSVAYAVWSVLSAAGQHRWTWDRLGYERSSYWYVYGGTVLLALAVAAVVLGVSRLLHFAWSRTARVAAWILPAWIAGALALALVAWTVLASLNTFVLDRSLEGLNAGFAAGDLDLDDAPPPPASPLRSGGPRSTVRWAEAGHEGRRFLTRGPSVEELAGFADGEVREPVRVYVGRASAESVAERVTLATDELDRFGAFEREAVLVVVPTGTGWINEQVVQPMEYLHGGDVATVAVQYSHLPSPLAFLSEAEAAAETAVALLEAVEERAEEQGRRHGHRPDVYVAGESLGSFGGSRAFASLADSRARVAGALWVGPPESMHLRREAERTRRAGTPQIRPVVGDGSDFVFVNRPSDLDGTSPHSVYLQQADDPIVWWDWDTLLQEPDWLREPRDPSVNPAMEWTPVVTFLHLAVDMAVSNDFDEDHGHKYGTQPLTAWHRIIQPAGWDDRKVERLREVMVDVER